MHGYTTFVNHHWVLWLILVILVMILIVYESRNKVGGILQISPENAVQLMNHEQALIIDLRDPAAYASGHVVRALNYKLDDLQGSLKKLQKYKSKPVIVYGQAQGGVAQKAAKKLQQLGFSKVQCLGGGLAAWRKSNLPLVKEV